MLNGEVLTKRTNNFATDMGNFNKENQKHCECHFSSSQKLKLPAFEVGAMFVHLARPLSHQSATISDKIKQDACYFS